MPYETFRSKNRRQRSRGWTRSVSPSLMIAAPSGQFGRIHLNASITRSLLAADVKSVLILWDKTKRGLALRGAREDDPNAHRVIFNAKKNQAVVACAGFLEYIGWRVSAHNTTVPATWNAAEKMIEAVLPGDRLK